MKLSEKISYREVSSILKFDVTPAAAASARRIAEYDHEVFIGVIHGFGFFRGTHEDMVDSGPQLFHRVRRLSKRITNRMVLGLKGNLTKEKYQAGSEMLTRARIMESTSRRPTVESNRTVRESPPVPTEKPVVYDALSKFRKK